MIHARDLPWTPDTMASADADGRGADIFITTGRVSVETVAAVAGGGGAEPVSASPVAGAEEMDSGAARSDGAAADDHGQRVGGVREPQPASGADSGRGGARPDGVELDEDDERRPRSEETVEALEEPADVPASRLRRTLSPAPGAREPFDPSVAEVLGFEDPHLDADSAVFAATLAGLPPEARADRADLEQVSRAYESAATADNTHRVYRQRFRSFSAWCSALRLSAVPAHPEVVRVYVILLAREHKSLSTLDVTLAAIIKAHRLLGRAPPASERLKLALRGLRKRLGPLPPQGIAIPLPVMRQIVCACTGEGAFEQRDRALLLAAYFGGLRRCQAAGLFMEHVRRNTDGYLLHLGGTKRNPFARRDPPTPVPLHADPVLCPVLALDAWIATRGKWTAHHLHWSSGKGPLFVALHAVRDRRIAVGKILSSSDVDRILTLRAEAAGIMSPLSAHGLRAGTGETFGSTHPIKRSVG